MKRFSPTRSVDLVVLLVCLVGLVAWGSFLASRTPYHDEDSYLTFDVRPDDSFALMHQSGESLSSSNVLTWSKATALDLESGDLWTPHHERFAILMHLGDDGKAHWLAETGNVARWDLEDPQEVRWIVTEVNSGKRLKSLPYRVRLSGDRIVLQERFLVSKREDSLEVIDLDAESPTPQSFPTSNRNRGIQPLGKSRAFVLYGQSSPPGQTLELFHVDDDGQVHSISSWSATSLTPTQYVWPGSSHEEVATIGVNANEIEVRSAVDGSIVRRVDLPADFDAQKMEWRFSEDLLGYLDKRTLHLVDWRQGLLLPSIEDSDRHWRHRDSRIVVRGVDQRRIIDAHSGEILGKFQSPDGLSFHDDRRVIVSSPRHGWTLTEFDLASGEVLRVWQPFFYVTASLVGWMIVYLAWCVGWTRMSVRHGVPGWIDAVLIGGIPLGLLVDRAIVAGDTSDAQRHVYQYAQGIAMAAAVVTLTWFVFGRTRITLRVMPLLGLFLSIAAALAVLFRYQEATAWQALASTFVPVVGMSIWLVTMRMLRWNIVRGDTMTTFQPTRYPLRDLFAITLLLSAGFAAVRTFVGEADVILDIVPHQLSLWISQIIAVAAIFAALSGNRWLFRIGASIIFAALIYMTVEPLARYASNRLYDIYPLLPTNQPHRILTAFAISIFALLMPFRTRGWRLRLTTGEQTRRFVSS